MTDLETCPAQRRGNVGVCLPGSKLPHRWILAFESPLAVVHVCAWCPAAKVVAPQGLGPIAAILEDLIRSEAARTATVLETHGLVKITSKKAPDTNDAVFASLRALNSALKNFP